MKHLAATILASMLVFSCMSVPPRDLPRGKATPQLDSAFAAFKDTVAKSALNPDPNFQMFFHNIMVVKDGKVVIEENFDPQWPADRPQHIFSASKTFTALAVGLAVDDGLMTVEDKVADYFPQKCATISKL
jgi:CubicO group peptidase (beta-lactamase class C family)